MAAGPVDADALVARGTVRPAGVFAALLATCAERAMLKVAGRHLAPDFGGKPSQYSFASKHADGYHFSLTVMVSAYAAAHLQRHAAGHTVPLMQDTTTQNVTRHLYRLLSVQAWSALLRSSTEAYGERGRVVLFAFTLLVILIIR